MLYDYWKLLRPTQWLKNLLLLFPPFLGGEILRPDFAGEVILPLGAFCLISSSVYVINDISDLSNDRNHPRKKTRPIASGRVAVKGAVLLTGVMVGTGLAAGGLVGMNFLLFLLAYLLVSVAYSIHLKNMPLVELFCVASGFLLRLYAGGAAFGIDISDWLFLSVFLLALFLVSGKRLSELRYEGGQNAAVIRPVLAHYPSGFLDSCMYISGSAVLVTYTMYVLSHPLLVYTVPLCCFGLLAYLLRVLSGRGGDPTQALLRDPVLLMVGCAWGVLVGFVIYGGG